MPLVRLVTTQPGAWCCDSPADLANVFAQALTKQHPDLSAASWASAVAGVVGGKAGGKGATSVGNGTEISKVDDGVEEARKWIEKFTL